MIINYEIKKNGKRFFVMKSRLKEENFDDKFPVAILSSESEAIKFIEKLSEQDI